jgi:hypothetical protein
MIWPAGLTTSLLEGHANAFLVSPDHPALSFDRLWQNGKRQPIGNIQGAFKFQRSAACRQIFDRATDRAAAAELDQAGFEDSVTTRSAAFDHDGKD